MVEERISNECKNKIHSLPFCISSIGDLHDIVIQFFSQPIKSLVCGWFPAFIARDTFALSSGWFIWKSTVVIGQINPLVSRHSVEIAQLYKVMQ